MTGVVLVGLWALALAAGQATGASGEVAQAAPAAGDPAAPSRVGEVITAEHDFAADAAALGINGSFNRWAAPGAIVIGSTGVLPVPVAYPPDVPKPEDEPSLVWWPNFAGVALSGDLGFTTGGVEVGGRRAGHYFTIWSRQADGSWKWVFDGGSAASAADVPGPDTQPVILQTSSRGSASPGEAMAEVDRAEQQLAARARTDQKAAHLDVLLPSGRLYVASLPPATGEAGFGEALDHWPDTFEFSPAEGGGASSAGDLVWTYGRSGGGGYYVCLWQRQEAGWALAFTQMVPGRRPPAAAVEG